MPEDTARISVNFPGGIDGYYPMETVKRVTSTVSGYVFVERVEKDRLHLVDEAGQRLSMRVVAPWVSFESVSVGTRFWLAATGSIRAQNPYASPDRSLEFSLRVDEHGPVLFATLQGTTSASELDFLPGIRVSSDDLCRSSRPLARVSRATGEPCTQEVVQLKATIGTEPPVDVLPGTRVSATIDAGSYDFALSSAYWTSFPDITCAPFDWAGESAFQLDVAARNWQALAAEQPVDTSALPVCRLGVADAPLLSLDAGSLIFHDGELGNAEDAISEVSSLGDTTSFSLVSHGTLLAKGLSAEARTVLGRAGWLSITNAQTYVIRESEGGALLAVVLSGTSAGLNSVLSRPDIFGVTALVEPRCEWMSDACAATATLRTLSLYDIVYGDTANHRVASEERAVLTAGTQQFDAWVSVSANCTDYSPAMMATFVATQ